MKWWGYLLAKLAVAGALIWSIDLVIRMLFRHPQVQYGVRQEPFAHDLTYTTVMMVFFLFTVGLLTLIIRDSRYRCRTCLRQLRMPVHAGSWPNMFLKGQPRMEYICIYGHGTLKVPEVELTGAKTPDWQKHGDDIWKELEALEESKR